MKDSTEKLFRELESEIDAQKAVYEKQAAQLPVFTKEVTLTTARNSITITPTAYPEYAFTTDGNERVAVTFNTSSGANTLAVLEITSDNSDAVNFDVKRVPFSGGAKWIVSASPRYDSSYNRQDTHYTFVVHSVMDGTLEAKMIWE